MAVQDHQSAVQLQNRDHQVRRAVKKLPHGGALLPVHGELGGLEAVDGRLPALHRGQAHQAPAPFVIEFSDVPGVEAEIFYRLLQALLRDPFRRNDCGPVRDHPEGPGLSVHQESPVLGEDLPGEPGVGVAVNPFDVHSSIP